MRYRLLGPLEVVRGGEVVDLGPPKQRAVLAVLLLGRGRVVSTDRLIDAVWETDAPPSATASLQAYISNLRRALRDNVNSAAATSPIVRQPPGYLLDVPAETVDIAEFLELVERARTEPDWTTALDLADQALGLWRGPVLADLRDEPWVQLESAGLDELRVEAREIRITALLAAGRVSPALVEAQQLHAEQPLRERTAWLYLLCLHRAGRTPDALAEYRRHTELLDEELGLEPGAELRDLQGAILRQDPELAAWPRSPQWTGARPQPEPERAPAEPVETAPTKTLVGRARETEILDRVLADVGRGATRWVVLTGPAGIGKTRLAEASAARLRADGAQEVWARCPDEDGAPAWWPIRQLVRGLGADPDVVLVPPPGADSDAARFAVYERVLDLLETSHDKKVLVVDDVQWADPTSVRCLAYLAGALRDRPVAVIVTLREGENEAAVQPLLTALARVEGHRQLTVPPLRNTEVSELADQISGERIDASEARLLAERTGGNPLFVTEYARLPREERDGIPLAVRSVLGRRLAGLDPAVLQVLRAAAVIGDVLEVDVLAAATGLDLDTLADQLDEAADEHLVVSAPGTGGYAFAHGLLREEVLAQMPALRRQRMHARVAAVLAGGPATPDRLSKRAGHLLSALPLADPAEVLEACVRAARDAAERWSSESAAQWWEAAITAYDLLPEAGKQGTERDDLLVARVEALARAGRGQTMLDVVEQGLLEAARDQRTESAGRLAATLIRSAGAWPWPGNGERPGPLLARLGQLESFAAPDPAAHARVLAAFAVGSCYDPDPAVPDRLSTRAMEIAEATGDNEVIADALLGRVSTYIGVAGHSEEAVELLGRLVKLGHRLARLDEVVADAMLTMPLMQLGDVAGAEERMRRAIAGSDLLRLPVIRVQMRWMSGTLALWRGDLDLAEQDFRSADQIHGRTELHSAGSTDMALNCLLLQQGRLAEADGQAGEPLAWGAAVAAARGEPEAAAHLVERFLAAPPLNVWTTLGHQALVAHTVADLGLTQHAPALLATLVAAEDRIAIIGQVGVVGPVAAAMARLHDLTGDAGEAQRLRDKAADLLRRTGGRLRRELGEG